MSQSDSVASMVSKLVRESRVENWLVHRVEDIGRFGSGFQDLFACLLRCHDEVVEMLLSRVGFTHCQVNQIYVTRGTKVVHLDLKRDQPDDAAILALLIGPSGKLRAPTLKLGKTLVVGFDQATYEQVIV